MHELQLEKVRLQMELVRTEDNIKNNYRHILSALSFRNIISTITELTSTTSIVSKAFTLGKNLLGRRKKKKQQKKQAEKAGEMVSGE
jgi:hypothetical protein